MNTAKLLAAAIAAAALMPAAALAVTLTNKDSVEHTVGIDMGNKEIVRKIPAGGSATFNDECQKDGCGFTGPWNYSVMLKGNDKFAFDGKSPIEVR